MYLLQLGLKGGWYIRATNESRVIASSAQTKKQVATIHKIDDMRKMK